MPCPSRMTVYIFGVRQEFGRGGRGQQSDRARGTGDPDEQTPGSSSRRSGIRGAVFSRALQPGGLGGIIIAWAEPRASDRGFSAVLFRPLHQGFFEVDAHHFVFEEGPGGFPPPY